jgi:2-oxo-3-hexenedioate decarboxylase
VIDPSEANTWAVRLAAAERDRATIGLITDTIPTLTVEDAYAIQAAGIALRLARGERVIGAKLGLTSRAKQERMGIDIPIFGQLTNSMQHPLGGALLLRELIHPRVEPEIVFVLGESLRGPGLTSDDVLAATEYITAGVEVIDSRFADFRFRLGDVVADNTSAARFILGDRRLRPDAFASGLEGLGVSLSVDGEVVSTATGAAVLGNPADAVALLANSVAGHGQVLEAGWIILSGGLTDAVEISDEREVRASFDQLGDIEVTAFA